MSLLKKIKIKHKLLIIILISFFGYGLVVFESYYTLNQVKIGGDIYQKIDRAKNHLNHLKTLESNLNRIRARLLTMVIEEDTNQRRILWERILDYDREIKNIFSVLLSENIAQTTREKLVNAHQIYIQFSETRDNIIIPSIFNNDLMTIKDLSTGVQKNRYEKFMTDIQLAFFAEEENVEELIVQSAKIQRKYIKIIISTIILVLIIIGLITYLISRSINNPINSLILNAHEIIKGNRKSRVNLDLENEIGILAQAFNEMLDSLDRSYQDLEQFSHIASHDLQEPLRKMRIYTDMVLQSNNNLDERNKSDLLKVKDAAERMSELIAALLKFSLAIENTEPATQVNLNLLLKEVINDLEIMIEDNNVKIRIDDLPEILGNKILLYQLFQNLIINGIKYHQDSELPHISISSKTTDRMVKIIISDNGIGIDQRYWKKVFMPFQKLHKPGEYSGSGIGLTLCKKIVEKHHGNIWVESTLNQGSYFIIELPRIKEE
jgi:signal transduction histidine kinase